MFDIFRNCQLVFDIAEKELGIPALLDPKVKQLFKIMESQNYSP